MMIQLHISVNVGTYATHWFGKAEINVKGKSPGRTFAAYESVIRREHLEELRRPLAV